MIRAGMALSIGAAALTGPAVASPSPVLWLAKPGIWELRHIPDGKPVRVCLPTVAYLAQVENLHQYCSPKVISSEGATTVLRYSCPANGFGQSALTLVTPRSVTIETQGISGGLPFNYVVNARRIGNCGQR